MQQAWGQVLVRTTSEVVWIGHIFMAAICHSARWYGASSARRPGASAMSLARHFGQTVMVARCRLLRTGAPGRGMIRKDPIPSEQT